MQNLTVKLLNKISVSSYRSKNVIALEQSLFQFLAIRESESVAILRQSVAFETKDNEFLC